MLSILPYSLITPKATINSNKVIDNVGAIEPISAICAEPHPKHQGKTPFCSSCNITKPDCSKCKIYKAYLLRKKGI